MKLILSFDTEDYLTPQAADAQLWWAEELSCRGIRGSFQCVSEVLRKHKTVGRTDVLEALARHETGFHTSYHSLPPTHPELTHKLSFEEARKRIEEFEKDGLDFHKQIFKQTPVSYCPPGDSWTAPTLIAMADAGMQVFCGAPHWKSSNRPFWYGALLICKYHLSFDRLFNSSGEAVKKFKESFLKIIEGGGEEDVFTLYSHPTRLYTRHFWDKPFFKSLKRDLRNIPVPELHSSKQIETNKDNCRRILDWLQNMNKLQISTYEETVAAYGREKADLQTLLTAQNISLEGISKVQSEKQSFLTENEIRNTPYGWPILPEDLDQEKLMDFAVRIAWTSSGPHSL